MILEENAKYINLINYLKQYKSIAVAFSGGVDSTLLLTLAQKTLKEKSIGLTIRTPYIPNWEIQESIQFTSDKKINHKIIDFPFIQKLKTNPTDRCYWCKTHLFQKLQEETTKMGYEVLMDGTNFDDLSDYRPGLRALKELKIISPFVELQITKSEIRRFSQALGLPTSNKPAYACLLTRIPYGQEIFNGELKRIEQAEVYLMKQGFKGHRVRLHGNLARIELQKNELENVLQKDLFSQISVKFKEFGFTYVTIDLEGYRMGSLNESL
jgi:pyridinium-3,5-biscarboxylic acid mononucleotide sulfurtransferase